MSNLPLPKPSTKLNPLSHSIIALSRAYHEYNPLLIATIHSLILLNGVAEMLNSHVYHGSYNTCASAKVPSRGLNVINVQEDDNPRRKYVNSHEVSEGMRLINKLQADPHISNILVITPVSISIQSFDCPH